MPSTSPKTPKQGSRRSGQDRPTQQADGKAVRPRLPIPPRPTSDLDSNDNSPSKANPRTPNRPDWDVLLLKKGKRPVPQPNYGRKGFLYGLDTQTKSDGLPNLTPFPSPVAQADVPYAMSYTAAERKAMGLGPEWKIPSFMLDDGDFKQRAASGTTTPRLPLRPTDPLVQWPVYDTLTPDLDQDESVQSLYQELTYLQGMNTDYKAMEARAYLVPLIDGARASSSPPVSPYIPGPPPPYEGKGKSAVGIEKKKT